MSKLGVSLAGKSRPEIEALCEGRGRAELVAAICSLATLEPLVSAPEIARAERMSVRDVRRAINAGELGGGFFCRGGNSKKVTVSAANEWRSRTFVRVKRRKGESDGNGRNGDAL